MTSKEALEKARKLSRSLSDIPVMSEEKVQRLMSQPSATFIRHKKPESDLGEEPKKTNQSGK